MPTQEEYDKYRDALKENPNLPLSWEMVINISEDFSPEQRQRLTEELERIQATGAGQEMLKEILLRDDQNEPLSLTYIDAREPGSQAFYDSAPHEIQIYEGFFHQPADPEEGIEDTLQGQYLAHELGHATDHRTGTFRDAGLRTQLDYLFLAGQEERKGEDWQKRYTQEAGLPPSAPYFAPEQIDMQIDAHLQWGLDTEEGLAEKLSRSVIIQASIDGKTPEEAVKMLDEEIERIKQNSGIDLKAEVDAYLQSPAPQFDDNDEIIAPAKEAGPAIKTAPAFAMPGQ